MGKKASGDKKAPGEKPSILEAAAHHLRVPDLLKRIAQLPSPEERERAKRALALHYQPSLIINRTPEATELEALGWEAWLQELAPHVFRGTHAEFHRGFWDWYWPLLLAKRDGKRLVNMDVPLAYLLTWSRGMGKSTSVEWATIALGAMLGQVLTVYVSSTAKLASQHLSNIREEIEAARISRYYPGLANPEVGKFDNRYGWNQFLLAAQSGLVIFAVGLEEEVRGLKRKEHRPALIVIDEFDNKSDSPDMVKKKESIIGGSIFGTQVEDTIVLMAQNLIHANSVATRTFKRRNELLTDRQESGLIKAFTDDLEIQMVGTKWEVIKGTPVWDYFDRKTFNKFLNTSGPIETYCHPAGTLITSEHGLVAIEECKTNDVVYAHTGTLRRVTGTTKRVFSGEMTLIQRAGRTGFVRATPEHRFYIARRKVSRSVFYKHRCNPNLLEYKWLPARDIRPGDYLTEPVPQVPKTVLDGTVIWRHSRRRLGPAATGPAEIRASKELCRLIGYYLAEGNGSKGTVRFDFHEKETVFHNEIVTLGRQVFGCTSHIKQSHGHGVTVRLNSTIARRFFDTFGKGAHRKFIPAWVFQLSPSLCQEIIVGYMRGDGNKSKAGFAFASASLQLAEGIRRLMLYCGIAANLYTLPPRTLRLPQGSLFTRYEFWMGTINGREAVKLGAILGTPHVRSRDSSGHSFIFGDRLHARVNDISSLSVSAMLVYNLHVEEDESYIADGASSHNCEYQHRFDLNKEGKVLPNYNDALMVITEEDFESVYETKRPPGSWNKYVFNDTSRTKTEWHAPVAGTLTMSGMNSPLPGITFLYDCLSWEADPEPDDCAIDILNCISPTVRVDGVDYLWRDLVQRLISREGLDRFVSGVQDQIRAQREGLARVLPNHVSPLLASQHYTKFRNSHEADDWRRVYREVFGIPFVPANPSEGAGVALMNLNMKVDSTVRDPFRRLTVDEHGAQRPLMGMSRFYIIVKKGKLAYPNDNKPDQLHGSDLARYQFTEHRYLAPKLNALGEKERGQEKRNDDFVNGCFVGDTRVLTSRGERAIKDIQVGEWVWTRVGWRRVLASGMTNPNAEVYTLETSAGILRGTGDHPVWVEGEGFKPLRVLRMDDILRPCPTIRPNPTPSGSFFRALHSTATPTLSRSLIAGITFRTSGIGRKALAIFTSRYGSRFTDPYPKASTFTTWTGISITTLPTTSKRSLVANMQAFTLEIGLQIPRSWRLFWPTSQKSDPLLTLGTQRQREGSGTASTPRRLADIESCIKSGVRSVVKNMKPLFLAEVSFAQANAGSVSDRELSWARKLEPAPCAGSNLRRISGTVRKSVALLASLVDHEVRKFARYHVRNAVRSLRPSAKNLNTANQLVVKKLRKSGTAPVYNLQVEGQPEYFANGILVHNCQFFFMDHSIQARELTPEEMREELMPTPLQLVSIEAEKDPEVKRQMMYAREISLMKRAATEGYGQMGQQRAGSRLADYRALIRGAG